MSIKSEITKAEGYVRDAYQACDEMGATMPQDKNLANLAPTIRTITGGGGGGGGWDPSNPTLDGLKDAINKGTDITIGTEIPDTWNGNDNPLIVAQKLTGNERSDSGSYWGYNGAEGYILVRKYVEPISQQFGTDFNYENSTIKNYLDTTYLNSCSETLKSILSDITVGQYNGSSISPSTGKWFLMSAYEVCGLGYQSNTSYNEGVMFEYWKNKTGLSSPDNEYIASRIMKDRSGAAKNVWLRSRSDINNNTELSVTTGGSVDGYGVTANNGILPACFISKD